ncbi:metallophosphoesterase [Halorutilales archaeon Cl-col2-1]
MEKVVITSDTHLREYDHSVPVDDADYVVHAGDFVSEEVYDGFVSDSDSLVAVHGNADDDALKTNLPRRRVFEVEGLRVGVLHGHRISSSHELEYAAMETDADLVVYGHSHTPSFSSRGVDLLNPGSPTRPRGSPPTYAEIEVEDGDYEGGVVSLESRSRETLIELSG